MQTLARIVAACASAAVVGGALAQDMPPERHGMLVPTISVTGEGEVSVDPNLAVVRLGMTAQEEEAAAAQDRVNQAMQRVIAAVKGAGVEAEHVQTGVLSLQPVYSSRPVRQSGEEPPEPRIVAYRADMTVTLRITDLSLVGDVIDAGLGAGANRLDGISFQLQDETRAQAAALQKAVHSASAKARAMAGALGVEVLGVIDAIEGGAQVRPVYYDAPRMELGRAMAQTPIEPGQIQVQGRVTLRYRISGEGVPRDVPGMEGAGPTARPRERMMAPSPREPGAR